MFLDNMLSGSFLGTFRIAGTCTFTNGIHVYRKLSFTHFEADLKNTTLAIFLKM